MHVDTPDPCQPSYESPIDKEPTPTPAVTDTVLLLPSPAVSRAAMLESDAHTLASDPLRPILLLLLTDAPCPKPRPLALLGAARTGLEVDPDGAFAALKLLGAPTSYDRPSDTLPAPSPAVIAAHKLPPDPVAALHLTVVSPAHALASAPVHPTRPAAVALLPSPPQSGTLKDASPAPPAMLTRPFTTDPRSRSMLIASLKLPALRPVVTVTPRLMPTPPLVRHCVDVSDDHPLHSHADPPTRALPDPSTPPRSCPSTTVGPRCSADPAFIPEPLLNTALSQLQASVLVLTATPAVAVSVTLDTPPFAA